MISRFSSWFLAFWAKTGLFIVKSFGIVLALVAWVGAAFLQTLLMPDSGRPSASDIGWGILIIVVGLGWIILQGRDAFQIIDLRTENSRMRQALTSFGEDYRLIWNTIFQRWMTTLRYDGRERISVYQHNADHFIMLGRYSETTVFCRRNRAIYPDNEGCIGRAWHDPTGECFARFPDPQRGRHAYNQHQENRWGLSPQDAAGLTMGSRSIFAVTISDLAHGRRAIVVFESVGPRRLDQQAIRSFLQAEGVAEINVWLDAMKNQLPTLALARGA